MAALLNYGKPQILELFKITLPSRLYWVLFPIEDLRVAVDTAKRVLMKEKTNRQLLGQSDTTTPFMKVGDVHNSNRNTVSFNTQDPIWEQLDNLTSMVYNMSIQKEEYNRPFKPVVHQKRRRGQNQQTSRDRDRNRSSSRDRAYYRWHYDQNFRPSYRRQSQDRQDNRRGNYRCPNYGTRSENRDRSRDRINCRWDFSNDRNRGRDRDRGRTRERCLMPRRDDRRYQSPNSNLGTRNRSTSRVTMNRDRVRCYKSREYDHFANECQNSVMDDSDGYESDRAVLQLIATDA